MDLALAQLGMSARTTISLCHQCSVQAGRQSWLRIERIETGQAEVWY